jgi:hypothetical protein
LGSLIFKGNKRVLNSRKTRRDDGVRQSKAGEDKSAAKSERRAQTPILLIGVGAKKKPDYLPSTIKFYKIASKSQTAL